jgi:SAM-dependent methyltransferase
LSDRAALKAAYDRQAATYGKTRNARFDEFRDAILDWFSAEVAVVGTAVLDVGSGPGHESLLLRERGLDPLAIDFSPRMIEQCHQRGVAAVEMDFYALSLPAAHFAGAWISFSLLHVPKQDVAPILQSLHDALAPDAIAAVLLFEGTGEGPRTEDVKRFGFARYFAYYRPEELRSLVGTHFDVVRQDRLDISPRPTLLVAGRRRGAGQGVPTMVAS